MRITKNRVAILLWLLEHRGRAWTIYRVQQELKVLSYPAVFDFIKQLESIHCISKVDSAYQVTNVPAIINLLVYYEPFVSKKKYGFYAKGLLKMKLNKIRGTGLDYALTLFAAGELINPYVATKKSHVYVREKDLAMWKEKLIKLGVRPAEEDEADLFLIPTTTEYVFSMSKNVHGYRVAPMGIVLSDLLSYGGLGEEQANLIMKKWKS